MARSAESRARRSRVWPVDVKIDVGHHTHGVLDEEVMEKARQRGLRLKGLNDEDNLDDMDRMKQIEIIKSLPVSFKIKKTLRDKMNEHIGFHKKGACSSFCYRQKLGCYKKKLACKVGCAEFDSYTTLWGGAIKKIEGYHGTGVATYFTFLRWMLKLNMLIFLIMLIFLVLPQVIFDNRGYTDGIVGDLVSETDRDTAANCSALYDDSVTVSKDVGTLILNFFEGSGWMEQTALFMGFYSDREVDTFVLSYYNIPLAYLTCIGIYFLVSLFAIIRQTSEGIRDRLVAGEQKKAHYSDMILCGWDYAMYNENTTLIKKKALYREALGALMEEKRRQKQLDMTGGQECKLWTVRVLVNLFVIICLGGAGYLLFYVTEISVELISASNYLSRSTIEQFLIQYMVSFTITGLNGLFPFIFNLIVAWEDYSPAFEVNITLIRTVFLKLSSLAITIATLYNSITCTPKDSCNVGTGSCNEIRCWETYVGQELYKLVIMDFFVVIAVTFAVEFPRRLVVDNVNWSLAQKVGRQEFDIPKNVLDLIYGQILLWLGTFFSPLLPAIIVIKNFFTFYIKQVSLLYNMKASEKPFRASDSHNFFMNVLLLAYVLCAIPLVYISYWVSPSKGCGPFRVYGEFMDIISVTISGWPNWMNDLLSYITSGLFLFVIITILVLWIYFVTKMKNSHKKASEVLREELALASQDKTLIAAELQELEGGEGKGPPSRAVYQTSKHGPKHPPKPSSPEA